MFEITTLSTAIFAFYLLVFCNFTKEVMGCRLQQLFDTNMIAKHMLSWLLLLALVVMVSPDNADLNIAKLVIESLVIYVGFFMTTRTPLPIMLFIIVLLCIVYILNATKTRAQKNERKEQAANIEKTQKIITVIAFALSAIGFALYWDEKKKEYGRRFDLTKFLSGSNICRKYTPNYAKVVRL